MSNLNYIQNGDYLIPDLKLKDTCQEPLGKYGRMRKAFLQENNPILWNSMILDETLFQHLREIQQAAENRLAVMMPKLQQAAGATEEMKRNDPLKWAGLMNTLKAQAEEVILQELIYS